jgi:hypothetical protein
VVGDADAAAARTRHVDVLDADCDAWRLEPYLAGYDGTCLDRAVVVAAVMRNLLLVGPDDQVMAQRG